MKSKERLELARWAVAEAKKQGADEAAVTVSHSRDIEVEFRERKMETLNESTQRALSLTVYAKGRYSSHSTNDLRREALQTFIAEAVPMTGYLGQDPFRSLPDPKYYEGRQPADLGIYDVSYEKVAPEERVQIAKAIEEAALGAGDNIISCTAGYSDSIGESTRVHSNGFEGENRGTSFSAGASVTLADGEKGRPSDYFWASVRFKKDFPNLEFMGREAYRRVKRQTGQVKLDSGTFDMVIENRVSSRILGAMSEAIQGRALQQKRSYLEGKLGQKVASEKLTIVDDPFIKGGLGSRLYDGDGITAVRRPIIEKGILKNYYIDYYYSRKLNVEPTSGSASNVIVTPGDKNLEQLLAQVKKGILVTGFVGGNSNATTGDFSYGIVGQYIENGQIIKPVNEMNISGNLNEFWDHLVEMGNDIYTYSSWLRPSMYFKDIFFSGV